MRKPDWLNPPLLGDFSHLTREYVPLLDSQLLHLRETVPPSVDLQPTRGKVVTY